MPKIPSVKARDVQRVIEKLDFELIRQSGSHAIYRHADGRWTTVPVHRGRDIPKGTFRKILADADITIEEFNKFN